MVKLAIQQLRLLRGSVIIVCLPCDEAVQRLAEMWDHSDPRCPLRQPNVLNFNQLKSIQINLLSNYHFSYSNLMKRFATTRSVQFGASGLIGC